MADFGTDLIRANIVYTLGSEEISVNTLHMAVWTALTPTGGDWRAPTQADLNIVADALATNFSAMLTQTIFDSTTKLDHVDAYTIAHAAPHHATAKGTKPVTGVAGTGSNPLPKECAMAVTLFGYDPATYTPNRAQKRGRMFLGGFTRTFLDGAGHIPSATGLYFATTMAGIMHNLRHTDLAGGFHPVPVIASRTSGSVSAIQATRCDNLMDVQRRRQRSETKTYSNAVVAP